MYRSKVKTYSGTIVALLMAFVLLGLSRAWSDYYQWLDEGGILGLLLLKSGISNYVDNLLESTSMQVAYAPVFILFAHTWFSGPLLLAGALNKTGFISGFLITVVGLGIIYLWEVSGNTYWPLVAVYYLAAVPFLLVPYTLGIYVHRKLHKKSHIDRPSADR
jgi:hypothetical protein